MNAKAKKYQNSDFKYGWFYHKCKTCKQNFLVETGKGNRQYCDGCNEQLMIDISVMRAEGKSMAVIGRALNQNESRIKDLIDKFL